MISNSTEIISRFQNKNESQKNSQTAYSWWISSITKISFDLWTVNFLLYSLFCFLHMMLKKIIAIFQHCFLSILIIWIKLMWSDQSILVKKVLLQQMRFFMQNCNLQQLQNTNHFMIKLITMWNASTCEIIKKFLFWLFLMRLIFMRNYFFWKCFLITESNSEMIFKFLKQIKS